MRAEGVAGPRR
uniref:Uncharacterized protein n=1 Tax=Arundo donax TaxID=35708 RepID=A0A0A9AP73_ARUDO